MNNKHAEWAVVRMGVDKLLKQVLRSEVRGTNERAMTLGVEDKISRKCRREQRYDVS